MPLPFPKICFSDVGDSAIKYKMMIFKPKPTNFEFFGLVPQSPTHTGLICVKTQEPNSSSLAVCVYTIIYICIRKCAICNCSRYVS